MRQISQVDVFASELTQGNPVAVVHGADGIADGQPRHTDEIVQECAAGLIRVRIDGDRLAFAAPPLLRDGPVDPIDLAEAVTALGIDPEQVVDAAWADNGPGWVAMLLDSAETVLAIEPDTAAFGVLDKVGVVGPHSPGTDTAFEVRAFFPGAVGEDLWVGGQTTIGVTVTVNL